MISSSDSFSKLADKKYFLTVSYETEKVGGNSCWNKLVKTSDDFVITYNDKNAAMFATAVRLFHSSEQRNILDENQIVVKIRFVFYCI